MTDDLRAKLRAAARPAVQQVRRARNSAFRPVASRVEVSSRFTTLVPGTVLFWIPEAGVTPHLSTMEVLARTLAERGTPVVFTRCSHCFKRCPVMDMTLLKEPTEPAEARQCCDACLFASVTMLARYRLPAVSLLPYRARIEKDLVSLRTRTPPRIGRFLTEHVDFGSLALHDLMLAHKFSDTASIPDSAGPAWWDRLISCVEAYKITEALCETGMISQVLMFNDTALQVSARLGARRHGVQCRSIALATHRNNDQRRIVITNEVAHRALPEHASTWKEWRGLALPREVVREVSEDVIQHFANRGGYSHIYSHGIGADPDQLRRELGLDEDRRIIVAYTSSLDEDNAARLYREALGIETPFDERRTFPDQLTWINELAQFVASSTDLQLVIRVHPREDANQREGITSQHLVQLKELLDKPRDNVTVIWPRNMISSYDLACIADLALVSWSSIGLELARAGLPVLATSLGATHSLPRGDGVAWAPDPRSYFSKLVELSHQPPNIEMVLLAYRWYAMRVLGPSIDVSDIVRSPGNRHLPNWRSPRRAEQIVEAIRGTRSAAEANLAELRSRQSPRSASAEMQALREELGRLLTLIIARLVPQEPVTFRSTPAPPIGQAFPQGAALDGLVATDGRTTWIANSGRWLHVRSPLAYRLAVMCTEDEPTSTIS